MASEMIFVIVPIYKVEDYLDRCIESLVNQTYRNLEIILVDDGSPDRCPEICDVWAQKDSRIRVIHKTNGGVSSARNAGMEVADGAWFSFVDPDDYLPGSALENLMALQQQYQADLVCGSLHGIKTRNRSENLSLTDNVLTRQAFADNLHLLINEVPASSCAKLYNANIIKQNSVIFPLDTPWGEDAIFYSRYMTVACSIVTTGQLVYHYDMTRGGSAVKKYHENLNNYAAYQFEIQKELIQTIGGEHIELVKNLEKDHFISSLINYALYETNREKLALKIKEAAELFPEAANHEVYGKAVQQQNWLKVARLWKKNNIKWYIKVVINRTFGLNL